MTIKTRPDSRWKPIDTAPKDGTVFRGKCSHTPTWPNFGYTTHRIRKTRWGIGNAYGGPVEGWCYGKAKNGNGIAWEPTHWAPLSPPTGAEGKTE